MGPGEPEDEVEAAVVDDGPRRAHPHRKRNIALLVVGVLVVGLVGFAALVVFGGDRAKEASVQDARRRVSGRTGTTTSADAFHAPQPGVYLYEGTGTEDTSLPPLTEKQGPRMPATVVLGQDGCWRFRIDYNTHHWQDWGWCASPKGIWNTGGVTYALRDYAAFKVENTTSFTCPERSYLLAPGLEPGDTVDESCHGTSTAMGGDTTSAGPATYVGDEWLTIGGTRVRARHLRQDRTLSGAQTGTERVDWWVDPHTMLPYRNDRELHVDTSLGAGIVTYTEKGGYELTSLTPER